MQNRQKLIISEEENGLKPHFGPFLALNGPFLGQQIFFRKSGHVTLHSFTQATYVTCQKSKKSNGGKYTNLTETDGQTDPILEDPSVGPKRSVDQAETRGDLL